ncbi:hypothetical protein TrVE_jg8435 [Triparma verrucosa]|uniref:Major facilitator superfamily (MFS) profile domain-containing protein n=1 Tax=Triparma verrucosa TaxID=1606542 RepID=A0A9W7CKH9_9STRA|nr:hypothetical protein TrVE_jg8435 [Triparma verrucosa]
MGSIKAPAMAAWADYFGLGSISPLLPFFCLKYADSLESVGFILSAQYGGVILGSTLGGLFSDRIGRRNTLLIALTGDVIFFTATGFVQTVNLMVVVRAFAGIFTPLTAAIAWLLDDAGEDMGKRARNQGIFGMCSIIGFMSGAAMGGFMGFGLFEIVNCACGALALVALGFTINSSEPERPNADMKPEGKIDIFRSAMFISLAVAYFVIGLQFTGITTLVAIILPDRYDYVEWQIATSLMCITFVHFLFMASLKKLTAAFGTVNLILTSFLMAMLGELAFLFEGFAYSSDISCNFWLFMCTMVLPIGMTGCNILAPTVADKYGKNARGATVGMLRTIFNVGQALGPAYGVKLYNTQSNIGVGAMFFVCQFVLMVLTMIFLVWVWKFGGGGGGGEGGNDGSKHVVPSTPSQHSKVNPGNWQERLEGEEGDEEKGLVMVQIKTPEETKREADI